jgi:hypothetical protein
MYFLANALQTILVLVNLIGTLAVGKKCRHLFKIVIDCDNKRQD